jgi:hypothetical protein
METFFSSEMGEKTMDVENDIAALRRSVFGK